MKGCLNENQLAEVIDFLRLGYPVPLERTIDHILDCDTCQSTVIELCEVLDELDNWAVA